MCTMGYLFTGVPPEALNFLHCQTLGDNRPKSMHEWYKILPMNTIERIENFIDHDA